MTDDRRAERRRERIVALIDALHRSDVEKISARSHMLETLIEGKCEDAAEGAVDIAIAAGEVIEIGDGYPPPFRLDELVEAIAGGDAAKALEILRDEWPGVRPLSVTRRMIADRNTPQLFNT